MDPLTASWLGPAAQLGGSLIGGFMNADAQGSANNANHVEAEINRGFQERMRSTSHQTEVKDLIAAGLNPILSAGGPGAAMASGSQATADAARPGDGLSTGVSSAFGVAKQSKELDAIGENINNVKADTKNKNEQTSLIAEQTKAAAAGAKLSETSANQINKMLPSMLKKAEVEGDFAKVNAYLGVGKSLTDTAVGAKNLFNPLNFLPTPKK